MFSAVVQTHRRSRPKAECSEESEIVWDAPANGEKEKKENFLDYFLMSCFQDWFNVGFDLR